MGRPLHKSVAAMYAEVQFKIILVPFKFILICQNVLIQPFPVICQNCVGLLLRACSSFLISCISGDLPEFCAGVLLRVRTFLLSPHAFAAAQCCRNAEGVQAKLEITESMFCALQK